MNKQDYFLRAMHVEEYRRRAWVISAFTLINEGPDDWKDNPYPYRLIQTPTGFFFVDPDRNNELTKIDDGIVGQSLFQVGERLTITELSGVPNYTTPSPCETIYGNLLWNFTILIYPFGNKIPYVNKRISPTEAEELFIGRLKDNPTNDNDRNEKDIYIDEYLKFCNACFYLAGLTQICVPAGSLKSMVVAPGMAELKARLIEENKDRLHDPAVIAKIDAELVKHDRTYLKGDVSEGFFMGGNKQYQVVRKKLFGMVGGEAGLDGGQNVTLVKNSLAEGLDVESFPAMMNTLRAGSYNRGAETQLGGEAVKWLFRASSNINVTKKDCGTKLGITYSVLGDNYKWLIGFSIVTEADPVLVSNEEVAKSYIGKTVIVRSPMYCALDKTDFCACCVGTRLAENPTGLSTAIAEYGSVLMSISMSAMHGKALTLAKYNFKSSIF